MNLCNVDNAGRKISINGLIVDESSLIRNTQSKLFKSIETQSLKMEYVYLLSGKPAPNRTKEYLAQLRILSDELYLKCKNILMKSKESYDFDKDNEQYDKTILQYIEKVSLTVSKKDCLDLPDTVAIIRKIEMPYKAMNIYNNIKKSEWEIVKKAINECKNDKYIFKYLHGSLMKLRQVANGIINTSDIKNKPQFEDVHKAKIDELLNIIQELGAEQAIIWAQFKYDIYRLSNELQNLGYSVATAYSETVDVNQSIHDFKSGKVQFLIAHPKTLQYGVTLVNCSYAIYYSLSYSFEEYYQSHDRIYRKGQTKACTYIFLNSVNTIDEIMYEVIMNKNSITDVNESFLKHLAGVNSIGSETKKANDILLNFKFIDSQS